MRHTPNCVRPRPEANKKGLDLSKCLTAEKSIKAISELEREGTRVAVPTHGKLRFGVIICEKHRSGWGFGVFYLIVFT